MSQWGPGPWQDEPDRLEWKDERTGLACKILRNTTLGNLCGYVGLPATHPYFGWNYGDDIKLAPGDLEDSTINDVGIFEAFIYAMRGGTKRGTIPLGMTLKAHGGITWTGTMHNDDAGLWWIGFDTGHCDDLSPGLKVMGIHLQHQIYRDIDYVKKEVTSLAFQLRQLETRVLIEDGVLQLIGTAKA
jgi:hypothetical protein